MRKTIKLRRQRQKGKVKGAVKILNRAEYEAMEFDSRIAAIKSLIPLGLMLISEELQKEVDEIAGARYQRKKADQPYRYGSNPGSVKLDGQILPMTVPRIRSSAGEIPLSSYNRFHKGSEIDDELFRRVLYGISCRDYELAAKSMPEAIGISKSTVSRKFIEASKKHLKSFQERSLEELDIVAIFLDGKTFAEDEMIIALGVTINGNKIPIGFIQTDTENKKVIKDFLQTLLNRGLNISQGMLVIIDGSKGLRAGAKEAFSKKVVIQRCQWHKRENVLSYLPRGKQVYYRRKLQKAYSCPTYKQAKKALEQIHSELEDLNPSAAASLREGLEETLTLHRLGIFTYLGRSLKTTNCIESINAMAEQRCCRVDYWKTSKQKHRWLAAALLDIEPRLNRICGHSYLLMLREALIKELKLGSICKKKAA